MKYIPAKFHNERMQLTGKGYYKRFSGHCKKRK